MQSVYHAVVADINRKRSDFSQLKGFQTGTEVTWFPHSESLRLFIISKYFLLKCSLRVGNCMLGRKFGRWHFIIAGNIRQKSVSGGNKQSQREGGKYEANEKQKCFYVATHSK